MDINEVIKAHTKKTKQRYKTRKTFKTPVLTIQDSHVSIRRNLHRGWSNRQHKHKRIERHWENVKRKRYVGVFIRTGIRIYGSKKYMRKHRWARNYTALFRKVHEASKDTDHGKKVWVPYAKELQKVGKIHKGDKIEFVAKVRNGLARYPSQFKIVKRR